MNSASYTAWEWRWRCLEALAGGEAALAAEARFLAALAADSPKNYQLWNHRRRLAFERGPAHALEVRLCAFSFSTSAPRFKAGARACTRDMSLHNYIIHLR